MIYILDESQFWSFWRRAYVPGEDYLVEDVCPDEILTGLTGTARDLRGRATLPRTRIKADVVFIAGRETWRRVTRRSATPA